MNQGPVVQSIVSLTISLVVKMLIVLVSTSNSQVFLLKKYAICNGQNFNDTLTKDIDSFEQLAPGYDEVPEDNKWKIAYLDKSLRITTRDNTAMPVLVFWKDNGTDLSRNYQTLRHYVVF